MSNNFLIIRDDKLTEIFATDTDVTQTVSTPSSDNDEDKPFEANLINSTVYIVAMALQISTFAINYRVINQECQLTYREYKKLRNNS